MRLIHCTISFFFSLEDHLFTLHFRKKVNTPLYLSSVESILEKSLTEILQNLKNSYPDNGDNIVYVTICQKTLVNPIRSGTYHIQDNDLLGLVNHIMASFNNFLRSATQLRLDDTFEIYFKVLGSASINYNKHRRKTVPLRRLVGANHGKSDIHLKGGLLELPTHFPNGQNSLENMCLLSTVIYAYLKFGDPEKFKKVKKIAEKKSSAKQLNEGSKLLYEEIKRFCDATSVSILGPHDFLTVIPKLSEFYNVQIHLIESMDNLRKVSKISSPEQNDLNRYRIYLFQTSVDHVVLIEKLAPFFGVNKRKICFDCGQFNSFVFRTNTHRCYNRVNCNLCLGCIETEKTIKVPHEIIYFCDSKLSAGPFASCLKCRFTFNGPKCFENHKKGCAANKLRIKCNKCDVYYLTQSKENYEKLQKEHVCHVWPKRCTICKEINSEKFHICKIKVKPLHSIWPNLGFVNMKFKQNSYGNCQKCFLLKDSFMKKNKLSFKELFVHKDFETLICDNHKSLSIDNDLPNIISLICEEKNRFHFQKRIFVDNSEFLAFADQTDFISPYCDNPLEMTPEVFNEKKTINIMSPAFYKNYLANIKPNSALDQFILFLCSPESGLSNYTFIVESNNCMFSLLRYFLKLQVVPFIIQQESTINYLEVTGLRIKFILRNSYLKGSAFEVGTQYDIKYERKYFPDVLNHTKYYNFIGKKPDFQNYQLFTDTLEETEEKKNFYETLPSEWNFNEQIMSCFQNETLVSVKATLKFLQQAFNIQKVLATVTGKPPNAVHPFNGPIMSLSGFSYALFHFYYYNDLDVFTVMNPDVQSGRTQTSRPEFEYISWLNFHHGGFIQGAFNCPEGQKYFGKYSVDGYNAVTKTVYQFRG